MEERILSVATADQAGASEDLYPTIGRDILRGIYVGDVSMEEVETIVTINKLGMEAAIRLPTGISPSDQTAYFAQLRQELEQRGRKSEFRVLTSPEESVLIVGSTQLDKERA